MTRTRWSLKRKKLLGHPNQRLTLTIDMTPSGWLRVSMHDEWNRIHSVRSCSWATFPTLTSDVHRIEMAVLRVLDEGVADSLPF